MEIENGRNWINDSNVSLQPCSNKKIIRPTQNKTEKNIFNFLMEKKKLNGKMLC